MSTGVLLAGLRIADHYGTFKLVAVKEPLKNFRVAAADPSSLQILKKSGKAEEFSLDQIASLFPHEGFERRVDFWRSIYAEYSDHDVVFHDRDNLAVIYGVVHFPKGPYEASSSERNQQKRTLEIKKAEIEAILSDMMRLGNSPARLGPQHRHMLSILNKAGYDQPSSKLFKHFSDNIRYQRGVKNRFQAGVIRSGRYLAQMEEIFERYGLPTELTLLPHVESSFNYQAYSKVGAAGIWQFMPATGRQYLSVGHSIDERLSPLKATEAAAQFLKRNQEVLRSWPLAVTAYNHGRAGMARAQKQHGSDLPRIIQEYRSRTFGFASKNFYSEFLAAVEVAKNYKKYFGHLKLDLPLEFEMLPIRRTLHLSHLPDISADVLRDYNPELTSRVWSSKMLPGGFALRVPVDKAEALQAALKGSAGAATLQPKSRKVVRHRVRPGENLIAIASRFGVSARQIQQGNGIRNANRIYPGQVLAIH